MADRRYNDLVTDLTALGRGIDPPAASTDLATAVMNRVATLPAPAAGSGTRSWTRRLSGSFGSPRRRIAVAVVAVLLALLATPPVRAAVADWFGFAGVLVERGSPSTDPSPPPEVAPDQALSEAAQLVDFTPSVPQSLGPPDGVELSADRRVLSMSWSTSDEGVLRLDQFDARLDFTIAKRTPGVQFVAVDGSDALWFEEPTAAVVPSPLGSPGTR